MIQRARETCSCSREETLAGIVQLLLKASLYRQARMLNYHSGGTNVEECRSSSIAIRTEMPHSFPWIWYARTCFIRRVVIPAPSLQGNTASRCYSAFHYSGHFTFYITVCSKMKTEMRLYQYMLQNRQSAQCVPCCAWLYTYVE